MDGISAKVLITEIRSLALELTGTLVPKQPRLGSHGLVVAVVGLLQGYIGESSPCCYEASIIAGDTTVSDQYEKTERVGGHCCFCQAVG